MTPDVSLKTTSSSTSPDESASPVDVSSQTRLLSLDLLLAFSKMYGVIDSYERSVEAVSIHRLGARYRVDARQAMDLLLRILRERPPLARLAETMCVPPSATPPAQAGDPAHV